MDYVKQIEKEFPTIKAGEEDDWEWPDEAFNFLKKKRLKQAETLFKKLCLSQPQHFDGFEGLAYVYYLRDQREKALWFMQEALKRVQVFLEDESLDQEVMDDLEKNYQRIKDNEDVTIN